MSPLFMETGYEPNSPGSISAEDYTAGSEREGDGQQVGPTGKKRREKNRDAARKSRKKQTERADVLHEELQRLERSNTSLHKEIAALKKDLVLYTTALERHKPHCCLRAPASKSGPPGARSPPPSAGRRRPGPAAVPPPRANSALLAASSFSTSSTFGTGLQTLDGVQNARLPPTTSAPSGTASCLTSDLFAAPPSDPAAVSCPLPLLPAPHSLFADESRPTSVAPVSTSPVSLPAAEQDATHGTPSLSADSGFSDTLDAFLTKQTSFVPAPCNVGPPYSHVALHHRGLARGCDPTPYNIPNTSNPLGSFLPSTLQESTVQSMSASPQMNFPPFPPNPSYCQQATPNAASFLSLLTVPNPPSAPQTPSHSFAQSPPALPLLLDSSRDLSLTELLEVNDWILSGPSNV